MCVCVYLRAYPISRGVSDFFSIKYNVHLNTQITYNIKLKIQFKKITTHALNFMNYNSKHHKVFEIEHIKTTD